MARNTLRLLGFMALLVAATAASAHTEPGGATGFEAEFLQGLLHPLTGIDHLLALLAVGMWSAMVGRRSWVYPLAFANVMLFGALLGMSGNSIVAPAALEPMLAVSLIALGILVMGVGQWALPLVVGFALLHGAAHGLEFGAHATLAMPLGMLLSSLGVLALGVMGGGWVRTLGAPWQRVGGSTVALVGGALLAQMI